MTSAGNGDNSDYIRLKNELTRMFLDVYSLHTPNPADDHEDDSDAEADDNADSVELKRPTNRQTAALYDFIGAAALCRPTRIHFPRTILHCYNDGPDHDRRRFRLVLPPSRTTAAFALSPIGTIRLGDPTDKPMLSTPSWIAVLFSADMGIGLVF